MSALLDIIAGRDTEGFYELRGLRDGKVKAREWFELCDRDACQAFIKKRGEDLDLFVGVAPRSSHAGGKDAIPHSWLLYVDCDSKEASARARDFRPLPSLVVASGTSGNIHAYWALTEPVSPAWFERANRRLAFELGADLKVTDAARVLRPPGSWNHKSVPPRFVWSICRAPSYRLADVVGRLPDPSLTKPTRTPDVRYAPLRANDPLQNVAADAYYARLTGRMPTMGNVVCPFHDDNSPSLRLYETTWFCFGCRKGGSIYEFAAALWGLDTRGADFLKIKRRLTDALG